MLLVFLVACSLVSRAESARNPEFFIQTPLGDFPGACEDDIFFVDGGGLGCSSWNQYNCSHQGWDYSLEDLVEVKEHCPSACSLCIPQERVEFRRKVEEKLLDWSWCADNPHFTDIKGYYCSDWAGYTLDGVSDDYTEDDKKALVAHCGATFGIKNCSICEDVPMWQGHCNSNLGYKCISDNQFNLGDDKIDEMLIEAGICPASCGLCDRIDHPSKEDLMLACTNDPILSGYALTASASAGVAPFCDSDDNGWCKGLLDCNGTYMSIYIPERLPEMCGNCIAPSERLDCKPGTYRETSDFRNLYCGNCTPGKFNPVHNASECALAPEGHFVALSNANTALPCEAGAYSDTPGNDVCTACPIGRSTFGLKGQIGCPPCPVGAYTSSNGSARCDLCPRGRFTNVSGSTACFPCEGAHRITLELGAFSPTMCICDGGFFETERGEADCRSCLEGLSCPVGSSMVNYYDALHRNGSSETAYPILKEKYFAFPHAPLDVFECMSKQSCPGGALVGRSPCCDGCQGLNCGLCSENAFHSAGVCKPCLDSGWQIPIVLGVAPFAVAFFHHFFSYRSGHREVLKAAVLGSVTLGAAVFFAQVMGMYYRLLINWPLKVKDFFEGSSLVLFNFEVLRASCTFSDSLGTRFGLQLCLPIFVAVLFLLLLPISAVMSALTRGRFPRYALPSILNGMGMLFQAMFISLVAISISVFECYGSPNGKGTLRLYPFVECGSPEHSKVVPFGIAALTIYVFGFFALCTMCNYIAPRYYSNPKFSLSIRFLIFKFRPSTWWYGIVLMVRSALIGMVAVMAPDDGSIQFYLMLLFLILGLVAHLKITPFIHRSANNVELFEFTLLIIIITFGSWFIPKKDDSRRDAVLSAMILSCVGIVTASLMGVFAYAVFLLMFPERARRMDRDRLRKNIPAIQAAMAILLAMGVDDLERFLLDGNYIDHWHIDKASRFILVENAGIQGRRMSTQRLSKKASLSEDSLVKQTEVATQKIVVSSA